MKNLKTPVVIIVLIMSFMIVGVLQGWFGAGSYPYAQEYGFNGNRMKLINEIDGFKKSHHDFSGLADLDDRPDDYGNRHMYLYDSAENEIIHFFVEANNQDVEKCSLFLVGYNRGKILGNWRIINEDFNRKENLYRKRRFRDSVLDKLDLFYKDKGNNMFVFWK